MATWYMPTLKRTISTGAFPLRLTLAKLNIPATWKKHGKSQMQLLISAKRKKRISIEKPKPPGFDPPATFSNQATNQNK